MRGARRSAHTAHKSTFAGVGMKRVWRILSAAVVAVACSAAAAPRAEATVIEFRAVDLADVVAGEDLWMYDYFVSDFVFAADQGFSTYFDPLLYANLQAVPQSSDWDPIAVQPDLALPSAGFYDALALVNGASLVDPFTVMFVWLGGAGSAPGSQAFTVNQFDAAGNVSFLETGQTVAQGSAAVPEPATGLVFAVGAALACRARRKRA